MISKHIIEKKTNNNFNLPVKFLELTIEEDESGYEIISEEMINSMFFLKSLTRIKDNFGITKVVDHIEGIIKGRKNPTLSGDFGEILTQLILKKLYKHKIPVYKLRHRIKEDWSMRITDVFSLTTNGHPTFYFTEVKTSVNSKMYKSKVDLCEIHEKLQREANQDQPEILTFIARRAERDDEQLAILCDDYYFDKTKGDQKMMISLVIDVKYWDDAKLNELDEIKSENIELECVVKIICVTDIQNLMNRSYGLLMDEDFIIKVVK